MSRIDEERHKYFLGFEGEYASNIEQARTALKDLPRTNAGQNKNAFWLKEWITQHETMETQKSLVKATEDANRIGFAAAIISSLVALAALANSIFGTVTISF